MECWSWWDVVGGRDRPEEAARETGFGVEIATVTRRSTPADRTDLWCVTTPRTQGWIYPDHRYWSPLCRSPRRTPARSQRPGLARLVCSRIAWPEC